MAIFHGVRTKTAVLLAGVVGIAAGALGLGLARLAVLPPQEYVHFHANWALWVNGERVDFTGDEYMEDVGLCMAADAEITGPGRVHLHENNADVLHVHHDGVTWGHFLQNLGWAMGPDWVITDRQEIYRDGEGARLTFILNGFSVPPVNERLIRPGDRLLASFGSESVEELVRYRFPEVASNAPTYDETFDPAGCQGREPETFSDRLRRAFWL